MSKSTKQTSTETMKDTTHTPMPEIFTTMANKAIKDLNLVKAKFVVILPDGTTFDNGGGEIVYKPKKVAVKKPRQDRKMPYGAYSEAYKAKIEAMKVGDVELFTATPDMTTRGVVLYDVQGAVSTIAHSLWGNDAHKTHMNKTTNCVELLRMA
jgi:hypothetical protein